MNSFLTDDNQQAYTTDLFRIHQFQWIGIQSIVKRWKIQRNATLTALQIMLNEN